MEHFPAPEGARPIKVPYICREDYDGSFWDYAESQSWTEDELYHDPDFGSKPPHDIAAFFQCWLYFGFLKEVLRIAGVEWEMSTFMTTDRDQRFVTTTTLPAIIQRWKDQVASTKPIIGPDSPCYQIFKIVDMIHYKFVNKRFGEFEDYIGRSSSEFFDWPLISLSISALGWTLDVASLRIYNLGNPGTSDRHKWGSLDFLKTRSLESGWSEQEISIYFRDFGVDGQYYLGCLESPRKHHHCKDCPDPKCAKIGLQDGKYRTKHSSRCQPGDCKDWNVSDEVLKIVRDGKTPLVTWSQSQLKVIGCDIGESVYLAISHVWSDGMGNPEENSLPECLLTRFQGMVEKLYSRHRKNQKKHDTLFGPTRSLGTRDPARKPIGFWMDTLCVPVKDDEARKQAIARMRDIYQCADRVLVLDSWVQALPRSADIIEKTCRLYLSNWQNLLWTLQEAVLAQNLFIQFKNGPQTLDSLQEEMTKDLTTRIELYYSGSITKTLYLVPLLSIKGSAMPGLPAAQKFLVLLGGVVNRTTTKKSDETICLAAVLGIDPVPLLNIPPKKENQKQLTEEEKQMRERQACEKRMEKFLELIKGFEQRLIFCSLPRLKSEGFRWAPKSFLDQPGSLVPSIQRPNEGHEAVVKPNGGGLLVTYPGIKLGIANPHLGDKVNIRRSDEAFWCTMSLKPDENGNDLHWDPALRYAIIASDRVGKKEYLEEADAIVGALNGDDEDGYPRVRYICRAGLEWASEISIDLGTITLEEPDEDMTVSGDWVEDQRWCIM